MSYYPADDFTILGASYAQQVLKHLSVGDLVTCSCHGGMAIVIALYPAVTDILSDDLPTLDAARLYWIRLPHSGVKERFWLHTVSRLRKIAAA